jgi:hypothetical protein
MPITDDTDQTDVEVDASVAVAEPDAPAKEPPEVEPPTPAEAEVSLKVEAPRDELHDSFDPVTGSITFQAAERRRELNAQAEAAGEDRPFPNG